MTQTGPFQALQQRDGERAGRPGPRGLPGAERCRANAGQESPVRLLLPTAFIGTGVSWPVHGMPPHRAYAGTVGLSRGTCGHLTTIYRNRSMALVFPNFYRVKAPCT